MAFLLQLARNIQSHIAAAYYDCPSMLLHGSVEELVEARQLLFHYGDISSIGRYELVVTARGKDMIATLDPDNPRLEVWKQSTNLIQRRFE